MPFGRIALLLRYAEERTETFDRGFLQFEVTATPQRLRYRTTDVLHPHLQRVAAPELDQDRTASMGDSHSGLLVYSRNDHDWGLSYPRRVATPRLAAPFTATSGRPSYALAGSIAFTQVLLAKFFPQYNRRVSGQRGSRPGVA